MQFVRLIRNLMLKVQEMLSALMLYPFELRYFSLHRKLLIYEPIGSIFRQRSKVFSACSAESEPPMTEHDYEEMMAMMVEMVVVIAAVMMMMMVAKM